MFIPLHLSIIFILLLISQLHARPSDLSEGSRGTVHNFFQGILLGLSDVCYYASMDLFCAAVLDPLLSDNGNDYTEDEDMDDDEDWPPTTIEVVCVGLGRTGTTSLAIAFDMLGHHSYHDEQLLEVAFDDDEDDEEMFEEIGKKGYDVSFRTNAATAVKYNAKVILTVRDSPESYARSWAKLAHACIVSLQRIPFKWFARVQKFYPTLEYEFLYEATKLGNNPPQPEQYMNETLLAMVYVAYNERVIETVPAEDLLVFNVKEGWDPLCRFLNIPIPVDNKGRQLLFPNVNNAAKKAGESLVIDLLPYTWWIGPALLVYAFIFCVKCFVRRLGSAREHPRMILRRLGNVFWGGVHENAALVETVTLIGGDEENVKESKLGEMRKRTKGSTI